MADALQRQATSRAGFIRAYGMFWHAEEVDWTGEESSRRLELLGRYGERQPKIQVSNFWDQQGIYILYNDYGPYYVGRTVGAGMNLGLRLRQHWHGTNGSPHQGKWDRFSWFGWRGTLSGVDPRGLRKLRATPSTLLTDSTDTVNDLESLLIYALGTINVGNRRQETFRAAVEWKQIRWSDHDDYMRRVEPR
ncbi:GIY-YIG nuclease family protein [Phycicoccus flavus]|uniref:GIY-YIG nuclease family protein n=1 Tax=Phycicoccus flavus TaxID=2502783 RepID=UPI000FEBCA55|nr:GIY-YIG nuclease family protein [Phycicoccus flavus]NHA66846.1 GIY-YIG nuclease family protein [Phycicoccus flavus]